MSRIWRSKVAQWSILVGILKPMIRVLNPWNSDLREEIFWWRTMVPSSFGGTIWRNISPIPWSILLRVSVMVVTDPENCSILTVSCARKTSGLMEIELGLGGGGG